MICHFKEKEILYGNGKSLSFVKEEFDKEDEKEFLDYFLTIELESYDDWIDITLSQDQAIKLKNWLNEILEANGD